MDQRRLLAERQCEESKKYHESCLKCEFPLSMKQQLRLRCVEEDEKMNQCKEKTVCQRLKLERWWELMRSSNQNIEKSEGEAIKKESQQ